MSAAPWCHCQSPADLSLGVLRKGLVVGLWSESMTLKDFSHPSNPVPPSLCKSQSWCHQSHPGSHCSRHIKSFQIKAQGSGGEQLIGSFLRTALNCIVSAFPSPATTIPALGKTNPTAGGAGQVGKMLWKWLTAWEEAEWACWPQKRSSEPFWFLICASIPTAWGIIWIIWIILNLQLLTTLKIWIFEAITRLHKHPPRSPSAKTEHSQLPWGVTEKAIQGHKEKKNFSAESHHFSEDRLPLHWALLCEHLSASPCVNLYLYLLGSWAPPKAWHMVSSEAQNKNIASICTSPCFGEPISTLRKAGWLKTTFKNN